MKKFILNPLCAPLIAGIYILAFFLSQWGKNPGYIFNYSDTTVEYVTYLCYAISLPIALMFFKDFKDKYTHYLLFLFMWFCALLRESGIQHYLTTTDTTAFKIRFFTNPNNLLHEKLTAAFIILTVAVVGIYLLFKYLPTMIKGFFKLIPLYWTLATLASVVIIGKIADRFPGNYRKSTGIYLSDYAKSYFELFEEISETTLPLLFALAFIQYHYMKKEKLKKNN